MNVSGAPGAPCGSVFGRFLVLWNWWNYSRIFVDWVVFLWILVEFSFNFNGFGKIFIEFSWMWWICCVVFVDLVEF